VMGQPTLTTDEVICLHLKLKAMTFIRGMLGGVLAFCVNIAGFFGCRKPGETRENVPEATVDDHQRIPQVLRSHIADCGGVGVFTRRAQRFVSYVYPKSDHEINERHGRYQNVSSMFSWNIWWNTQLTGGCSS